MKPPEVLSVEVGQVEHDTRARPAGHSQGTSPSAKSVGAERHGPARWLAGIIVAVLSMQAAAQTTAPPRIAPAPAPAPVSAAKVLDPGSLRPAPDLLTNLDTALELPLEAAQRGQRVKAVATVTYCHPQWHMLFVRGAALGTYLSIPTDTRSFRPGDVVEIEGSTASANGHPEIRVESVNPTGQRRTLATPLWSLDDILAGRASGQWVQIEGRVLAAFGRDGRLQIQAAVGATNVTAFLLDWQPEQAYQLLDTRARITGVLSVLVDTEGHPTGVAVLAQEPEQVQVLQAAASNPLDLPITPISSLTVSKPGQLARRVHVQGMLDGLPRGPATAVRDSTGLVQFYCPYKLELHSDSYVDVIGYPGLAGGELVLKDAIELPMGSTTTPGNHRLPEPSPGSTSPPLLATAQAVHQLKRTEAARGYPVRLEAVVTYSDALWSMLFVQDESGGVFVAPASGTMEVRYGQRVRIQGVTAAGDFAPTVTKATFEVLGEAPMPAPVRVTLDQLLTGQFDCRWVEIRGLVQSVAQKDDRLWLYVMTTQGQISVLLGAAISMTQVEKTVGARVTLRGVVGGEFNTDGQIVSVRLHVPDLGTIQVDEAPAGDPFAAHTVPIADLSRYHPNQDVLNRVKICGRVTSVAGDQTITLQDESAGMLVPLVRCDRLPTLGEQVEILGFPVPGDFSITLKDAQSRVVGPGREPLALLTTPGEVLTNEPNARLVRMDSLLTQDTWLRPSQTLLLKAGPAVFEALLPANFKVSAGEQLAAGTRLEVTGVCLLEGGRWGQVKTFRLRVRHAGDLKVLSRPPWWNLRRLFWTLAGTGALGVLALAWNLLLAKKNRLLRKHVLERERAEASLQRAHAALQQANETLEQRVLERTRELQEQVAAREKAHAELAAAQQDLVEASRQAGMAEVATGVLHNVGNVVNSINVSTTLIRENLRRSEFPSLLKLKDLLEQHQTDMAAFLTTDPKGKRVPGFIIQLTSCLEKELAAQQAEHEQLGRNVEHIKQIVAMQQTYARVSGTREKLSISRLVDDAVQMNTTGFARYGIQIARHYSEVPPVTVDKHKVLQILVNLISNAKYALEASEPSGRQLTLEIGRNGNNRLKVAVTDNGVGISPDHLPRIFSHGFTTRKEGHGFGLHSAANAAQAMGGALTVRSEGVGKGATFTLELPLEQERTE